MHDAHRRTPLRVHLLEDRCTPANVTLAGELNSLQYAPNGELRQLYWNDHDLILRTGTTEQTVLREDDPVSNPFTATPGFYPRRPDQAQLVITPDGVSHVFKIASDSELGLLIDGATIHLFPNFATPTVEHYLRREGQWQKIENIAIPSDPAGGLFQLVADAGPNSELHIGVTAASGDLQSGKIFHSTNTSGSWNAQQLAETGSLSPIFAVDGLNVNPRTFDMAIDNTNHAHFAYTTGYSNAVITQGQIGNNSHSALAYANNSGGKFQSAIISEVPDGTGDGGLSASIAIAPNGQVGIAAHYVDRAITGSPQTSDLRYFARTSEFTFSTEVVTNKADGYIGGDGAHFTGANPDLQFDASSRPLIAFSDHASRHERGAIETAGQIRLAIRNGKWNVTTILHQSDTIKESVLFPTLATFGNDYTIAGVVQDGADFKIEIFSGSQSSFDAQSGIGAGVIAVDAGGASLIISYDRDGSLRAPFTAFEDSFTGGSRVALGDVNGDGVRDVIVGAGPGRAPTVKVYDGRSGVVLHEFDAFESTFMGGLYVASADIDGDGRAEVIVSPDQNGGPRVRVLSGANFSVIEDFFGIDDPNFRGGARVAVGDVNNDGIADLLIGAGVGGGPRLAGYDGMGLRRNSFVKLFTDFFLFEETLRNGVFLASGDLNGDKFSDVIAGGGPGGGPRVFALSGRDLMSGINTQLANFFAGDLNSRGGVRVSATDLDGDDRTDIVVGAGERSGSRVTAYIGKSVPVDGTPSEMWEMDAIPDFMGGVFVG